MTPFSQEDIDSLSDESQEKGLQYFEHEPDESKWGIVYYGDAGGGIGGGVPGFHWFPSKEEMFDYIGRLLPHWPPGPASSDSNKICETTTHIVNKWKGGEITAGSAISELNVALKRHSQITWCGQFEELLSGDSEFAKQIRERHHCRPNVKFFRWRR